tara:strand:- start:2523 stop:2960 length:438 start_codon:yes stop_codon:yes gene_type:complete
MANQSDRIHAAIYGALSGFTFPYVTYDKDTGLRTTSEVDGEGPETILVREIQSNFEAALGERRTPRLRERSDWQWDAEIAFDNQVSLELFETTYTDTPLFLPRVVGLNQQVTITLDEVAYTHPPEHASSSGSRAKLSFTASLSRK